MVAADTYLSVSGESQGSYREKGSKFLGFVFPVTSEEDVKKNLLALKKEFYNANHHCYAYRIGFPDSSYRVNDDGEPSGSAGKPIYGQILSHDLYDILVVVVRFFGGTKLGIPGLIRSYKTTSSEAIEQGTVITKIQKKRMNISFPYSHLNEVMRIIKQEDAEIEEQSFLETCSITLLIRISSWERVAHLFERLSDISIY